MTSNHGKELPSCPIENDPLAQDIWDDPALLAAMTEIESKPAINHNESQPKLQIIDFDDYKKSELGSDKEKAVKNSNTTKWSIGIAASAIFAMFVTLYFPTNNLFNNDTLAQKTTDTVEAHATEVGKQSKIILDDGSKLSLNADTRISVIMKKEKRRVFLEKGEAFFDIASNKNSPFFVETQIGKIEVVGTAFNVDQTRHGIEVKVYEGKVKVHDLNAKEYSLLPGQQLTLNHQGHLDITHFSLSTSSNWLKGSLEFKEKPMSYVIEKLNRHLEQKIYLDPSLNNRKITGSFVLADARQTLILLQKLYDLELLDNGDSSYLVSKG